MIIISQIAKNRLDMSRYNEKTDENRRSHTLLPRKREPRNAN